MATITLKDGTRIDDASDELTMKIFFESRRRQPAVLRVEKQPELLLAPASQPEPATAPAPEPTPQPIEPACSGRPGKAERYFNVEAVENVLGWLDRYDGEEVPDTASELPNITPDERAAVKSRYGHRIGAWQPHMHKTGVSAVIAGFIYAEHKTNGRSLEPIYTDFTGGQPGRTGNLNRLRRKLESIHPIRLYRVGRLMIARTISQFVFSEYKNQPRERVYVRRKTKS